MSIDVGLTYRIILQMPLRDDAMNRREIRGRRDVSKTAPSTMFLIFKRRPAFEHSNIPEINVGESHFYYIPHSGRVTMDIKRDINVHRYTHIEFLFV